MRHGLLWVTGIVLLAAGPASACFQDGWETYKAGAYGFIMPVQKGTKFVEKEYDGGWGGLYAGYQGAELFGMAHLGEDVQPEAIEKFGLKLTATSADTWEIIDKGRNTKGWRWFRTVLAVDDSKVVFGGYGTGPAGTYLLLMKTTKEDFEEYEAAYRKWYEGVELTVLTEAPKGWKMYRAKEYGFSMIVPEKAGIEEKEVGTWGGLYGTSEGVELYGLAHLGRVHTAKEIEAFGVEVTGIPADAWKVVEKGENRRGLEWYSTVRARSGEQVLFGGYGVGSKGSYLLVLVTTQKDFEKHHRQYMTWYASAVMK